MSLAHDTHIIKPVPGRTDIEELHQQLVIEPGEDEQKVARDLIGPAGRAVLVRVRTEPGDQWPTAAYRGTPGELSSIAAKARGSKLGKAGHRARQRSD